MGFDVSIMKRNVDHEIYNLQEWTWPNKDHGTWSYSLIDTDGPVADWLNEHSKKWFKHVKKFDIAIQAGGACGMYPRLLSEKFGFVYTFEPVPISFHCLVNNCQKENIIKIQAALGDHNGFVMMKFREDNVGLTTIMRPDEIPEGVFPAIPLLALDHMGFTTCDLLALDIEDYELNALNGAVNLINISRPVIVVENGTRREIEDFMHQRDYREADKSSSDTIWIPN